MKYIPAGGGLQRIELTRRNLMSLLAKLDGNPPGSLCMVIDPDYQIVVKAVEDDAHYTDRPPGPMHEDTEVCLTHTMSDEGGIRVSEALPLSADDFSDLNSEGVKRICELEAALEAAEAENERLRDDMLEALDVLIYVADHLGSAGRLAGDIAIVRHNLAYLLPTVDEVLGILTPTPSEPLTLTQKHMRHYQHCNCLGNSAECCVADCECHVVHGIPSGGENARG